MLRCPTPSPKPGPRQLIPASCERPSAPARCARRPAGSRSPCATTGSRASAATATTSSATATSARRAPRCKQLHEDPDRLRRPLVKRDGAPRRGDAGTRRSPRSSACSCRSSSATAATPSAVYLGNPTAHNLSPPAVPAARCCKALGHPATRFSASTVDQMPQAGVGRLHVRHRAQRARCPTSTAPTTC